MSAKNTCLVEVCLFAAENRTVPHGLFVKTCKEYMDERVMLVISSYCSILKDNQK